MNEKIASTFAFIQTVEQQKELLALRARIDEIVEELESLPTQVVSQLDTDILEKVGPQGPKGDKGDKGDKGIKGDKGLKGDVGPIGPEGTQGEKGEVGPQGVQGIIGPQGLVGAKGDRGPQGVEGKKGDQGIQGIQGLKGDKGEKGDVGPIGPEGKQGPQGEVGQQGPQGIRGEKGDVGPIGPKGTQGEKGDTGEPAPDYEPKFNQLLEDFNKRIQTFETQSTTKVDARLRSLKGIAGTSGGGSYKIIDNADVDKSAFKSLVTDGILIYDTDRKKFVVQNFVDIINRIKVELEVQYDRLIDFDGVYTYIGEATPGTGTSEPLWRIKRVELITNEDYNILWAEGNADFDNIWDNRASLTY